MRKHSLLAITLTLAIGLLALEVEAQEMKSSIQPPTSSESIGTFNKIAYARHQGRFVGQTENGPFDVPYEITAPSNAEDGAQVFLFEPPHFSGGPVTRDFFLGSEFLFENGFDHASIAFDNTAKDAIDTSYHGTVRAGPEAEDFLPRRTGQSTLCRRILRLRQHPSEQLRAARTQSVRSHIRLHGGLLRAGQVQRRQPDHGRQHRRGLRCALEF